MQILFHLGPASLQHKTAYNLDTIWDEEELNGFKTHGVRVSTRKQEPGFCNTVTFFLPYP